MKIALPVLLCLSGAIAGAKDVGTVARGLRLDLVDFREASFAETIEWLQQRSKQIDPEGKGVRFSVGSAVPKHLLEQRLNLVLRDVSVFEAAREICEYGGAELLTTRSALVVREKLPPRPGDESKIEGSYTEPPNLSGETLVLKDGRFQYYIWTDADHTKKGQSGKFQRYGRRLVLLGDDPDFVQSFVWLEFDGVPILFVSTHAYKAFVNGDSVPGDAVLHNAWAEWEKHPRLAKRLRL